VFFEDSTTNGKTHSKWQRSKVAGSRVFNINKDTKTENDMGAMTFQFTSSHINLLYMTCCWYLHTEENPKKNRKPGRKT
jgi:hypothetical protein